jgi:hypothetical protein
VKPKPVEVTWQDPSAQGGWRDHEETLSRAQVMDCTSVGYLVQRDETKLVLVQSHSPEQHGKDELWADSLAIPAAVVQKVRHLK